MIFETLLNPLTVYNIGINFVEVTLSLLVFVFFLKNAKEGRTERGIHGLLSLRFSLAFLLFAFARSLWILWDHSIKNVLFRAIAWISYFIGLIIIALVFYSVFNLYLPKLKLFVSIAIPVGIVEFIFYFFSVFTFQSSLFDLIILASIAGLIIFIPIYAFTKVLIEKGSKFRIRIIAIMFGMMFLVLGHITTSFQIHLRTEETMLLKALGHTIYVFGLAFFAIGFWGLPSLKELEWREKVRHLYLINEGGASLYDQSFVTEETLQSDLIAGSISGISSLIQELTKSKERVETIKQKDLKILLKYGKYVTAALIAEEDLEILHSKLKILINEFETLFQYILPKWKGDLEVFSPVKVMVERIFK
ncbi:MAG: hypothetical protein ACFFCM_17955 [Promethearchaeota archaeon]